MGGCGWCWQGYVGSTYRKTEDKIQARMKNIESKIQSFEQVVGEDMERRLINLEHIIKTLDDRIDTSNSRNSTMGGTRTP